MALEFEADNVPAEKLPIPLGWRILAAPVKLREVSEGGIALPAASLKAADHYRNIVKILAVGSGAYDDPSFRGGRDGDPNHWCKAGDIVVVGAHDGERVTINYNGENHGLRFIKDANIVGLFHDTSTIEALL